MVYVTSFFLGFAKRLHPLIERMRTDTYPLCALANSVNTHRDLMHRIALEIVNAIASPHVGILVSKEGGKALTKLGAPQNRIPF